MWRWVVSANLDLIDSFHKRIMSLTNGMKYPYQQNLNSAAKRSQRESKLIMPTLAERRSLAFIRRWGPDGGKNLMAVFRRLRSPAATAA